MLRIDFHSDNPELAVKVANSMTDAYIFDQLNAKYQANRRAGDWLQERLQALREQAAAAERAVIEFRAKNNIIKTGGTGGTGGTLINEKELGDASGELAKVRAQVSDLQIRIDRIADVRRAYQQDKPVSMEEETVSEAMSNAIISKLRNQYVDLVSREAEWSVRYGKNHTAVVNLRNQIRNIRKNVFDELGRIEETYKSEIGIAKKRQDELEKGLAGLISQSNVTNQAQVALFSLEAAAQSYRKLYDSFLQRHTETVQQQSLPMSEARSLSSASVNKTGPAAFKIWMVTIFAGGMVGVGLGAFREIMDRGFRTRDQVRSVLGTECLAMVPLLTDGGKRGVSSRQLAARPKPNAVGAIAVARRIAPRGTCFAQKGMREIVDSPWSQYADAIRSIKLTVDLNGQRGESKILGLTSCLPSEGKSTVSAAIAALIAQSGSRVILLDCDFRHPSLSRSLAPDASAGFLDVVAGKLDLANAVWSDPATGMDFLPAGANPSVPNATEILASDSAKAFFATLAIQYDYVIVDLAPLVVSMDVRATAGIIQSYILVVEWGNTKADAVQYALRHAPGVQANIIGTVLNKVNLNAMGRYDGYGSQYYYGRPERSVATN